MQRLSNKRVLLTGAGQGQGKAIAAALVREGARVAVHDLTSESAARTCKEIDNGGKAAFPLSANLRDAAQIEQLCSQAIAGLDGLDILVSNAGIARIASVLDTDESLWDDTININLKAGFLLTKHALPAILRNEQGAIIFNASTSGKSADANMSAYNASKHGLIGFMKCLAAEVGPKNVRVNAICPGWVDTPMAHDLHQTFATEQGRPFEQVLDEGMRNNMMKALLPPDATADLCVFLASNESKYITGQAINLCAGLCYW